MSLEVLTSFFGWMSVLNIGFMLIASSFMLLMRDWAVTLHSRMFGIEKADVRRTFYRFLAQFKILTIVFSLVPWIALKLV